jgi:hypothetical protein
MILVGSMGDWYVCEKCKHATMEEKNEENYGTVTSSLNEIVNDQLGLPKVAHFHTVFLNNLSIQRVAVSKTEGQTFRYRLGNETKTF